MNKKLTGLLIGTAVSAFAFSACQPASEANMNKVVTNTNTAVVINNNTNTVVTTNTNKTTVTREEYDKNKTDYEKQAKDTGSKIGQGADDLWLWTKTKTALAAADNLRDSTINLDVNNAVATLRGTVGSAAQRTEAETVAKGIEGVKSVTNDLQVKANDSMTNQMVNGNSNMANTKR